MCAQAGTEARTDDPSLAATLMTWMSSRLPPTQAPSAAEATAAADVVVDVGPATAPTSDEHVNVWDFEDAPSAGATQTLEIATLNLGGRNSNSFEFVLAGDDSELGARWQELYERAQLSLRQVPCGRSLLVPRPASAQPLISPRVTRCTVAWRRTDPPTFRG